MYLVPIRLPHKDIYLAPIISQNLDISHQSQRFWIFFSQMMSWGLYTKNDINQTFWVHLQSVMVCGLRENFFDWGRDLSEYPRKLCANTRIRFLVTHSLFLKFSWRKQCPHRILINWRKKKHRNKVKTNKDAETRFQGRMCFIVVESAITWYQSSASNLKNHNYIFDGK